MDRNVTTKQLWSIGSPFGIFKVFAEVARTKPDIVYFYYPLEVFTSQVLCSFNDLLLTPILLAVMRLIKIRIVLDLDDLVPNSSIQLKSMKGLLRHSFSFLTFRILSFSVAVFSLRNRNMISTLKGDYKINVRKLRYIPHGIKTVANDSIPNDEAKKTLKISGRKVVLYFGFLSRYKGIDQLIRAMPLILQRHKDAYLLLVGDYFNSQDKSNPKKHKFLPHLKKLVESLDLSTNVGLVVKYIPESEVALYFSAADVVCFPYITSNISASGVLSKAMAYGKPVVTSNSLWFSDIVNRRNGLVVPMADHKKLARAIIELLENDDLRTYLGNNLAIDAKACSWHNVAVKLSHVFEENKR